MDEEYMMPQMDVMAVRAAMLCQLAEAVENASNTKSKKMLLQAMESLLYTIDVPRGEVVEFKN
jgi:hypothetical protein